MSSISEFVERWNNAVNDNHLWIEAVINTEEELLEVNKQQLLEGKNKEGGDNPEYANYTTETGELYDRIKYQMNPRNRGLYDMRLTGRSFNTMRLHIFGNNDFAITSDGHAQGWNDILGNSLFGVYENVHMELYRYKYLYPAIVRQIKELTGAK